MPNLSPTAELVCLRACYEKADNAAFDWKGKYGWIVDVYKEEQAAIEKIHKEAKEKHEKDDIVVGHPKMEDKRDPRPFPETTSQEVGWLASKKEFALQKFGPDCPRKPSLEPELDMDWS